MNLVTVLRSRDEARLEAGVGLCVVIERNILGNTMKDELVRLGIIAKSMLIVM